jgi:hypothetical protein
VVDVTEILIHWYAGRSQSEVSVSLGVDRKTMRKYLAPAVAAGLAPGGPVMTAADWGELVAGWFPQLADTRLRQTTWPQIAAHHEYIVAMLRAGVTQATIHQRLRDGHGLRRRAPARPDAAVLQRRHPVHPDPTPRPGPGHHERHTHTQPAHRHVERADVPAAEPGTVAQTARDGAVSGFPTGIALRRIRLGADAPQRRTPVCYPQVRLNLSKLTVTVPLAFITNTVVSCAVIDVPSEPVAWIVRVNSLFWFCSFMLKLPQAVACPV